MFLWFRSQRNVCKWYWTGDSGGFEILLVKFVGFGPRLVADITISFVVEACYCFPAEIDYLFCEVSLFFDVLNVLLSSDF